MRISRDIVDALWDEPAPPVLDDGREEVPLAAKDLVDGGNRYAGGMRHIRDRGRAIAAGGKAASRRSDHPEEPCIRGRAGILEPAQRVSECAESEHASARVLAARLLAIGSKQKSAATNTRFSNVALPALSPGQPLPARSGSQGHFRWMTPAEWYDEVVQRLAELTDADHRRSRNSLLIGDFY